MARQLYPEYSDSLHEAYLDSTQIPHDYLILDLSQDLDDLIRFRTNVFPKECRPIIYAAIDDEQDNVELPCSSRTKNSNF